MLNFISHYKNVLMGIITILEFLCLILVILGDMKIIPIPHLISNNFLWTLIVYALLVSFLATSTKNKN